MMRRIQILLGVIAVLPVLAYGGLPQEQRARIQRLENAVLAPCCYTENVGQHQSEIAVQMRVQIAKWVEQGRTDEEILNTYAERYGAKVLVDPNTIPRGWTLVVPWAFAILGTLWRGLDAVALARTEACYGWSTRWRRGGPPGLPRP
jgi:cytochrome c-type biogenesis protein CcmH/NrfF